MPGSSRRGLTQPRGPSGRRLSEDVGRILPGRQPGDLGVGPRPRLAQIGQLGSRPGRRGDLQHRQRQGRVVAQLHAVLTAHDDQGQPRPQPAVGASGGRREPPRQVGRGELHAGQVGVLEAGGSRLGVGPQDLAGVETDDVAGSVEPHVHAHVVTESVDPHHHRQGDLAGEAGSGIIGGRDGPRQALLDPGQKRVGRDQLAAGWRTIRQAFDSPRSLVHQHPLWTDRERRLRRRGDGTRPRLGQSPRPGPGSGRSRAEQLVEHVGGQPDGRGQRGQRRRGPAPPSARTPRPRRPACRWRSCARRPAPPSCIALERRPRQLLVVGQGGELGWREEIVERVGVRRPRRRSSPRRCGSGVAPLGTSAPKRSIVRSSGTSALAHLRACRAGGRARRPRAAPARAG